MNKNILKKIAIVLGCIIGIIVIALLGFYIYIATTTKFNINDFEKELKSNKNITYISYEELPKDLINAILSAEDPAFFEHKGIDFSKYLKSFYNKSNCMSLEMQLINKTLSDNNANLKKIRLAYISKYKLQKKYSKNELLELYLNYSNFGGENYGIENASLKYFNKNTANLSLVESATLAGILSSPNKYRPDLNLEECEKRKDTVLMLMNRYGYLNSDDTEKMKSITVNSLLNSNTYSEVNTISEYEFIDYIKKTEEYLEISEQYSVNYKDIKYQAIKNELNEYGYTYKVYYNVQEVTFSDEYYSKIYDGYEYRNAEVYYLDNDAILIISTITPVADLTTYDVRAFSISGKAIFSDVITGELIFNKETHELSYNNGFGKEYWLGVSDGNICEYIKEIDNKYIVSSNYKYKFSNNDVELLEKNVITIKDLKEEYNCQ